MWNICFAKIINPQVNLYYLFMTSVYCYPNLKKINSAGYHLEKIFETFYKNQILVKHLTNKDFIKLNQTSGRKILFINWLDSLYFIYINKYLYLLIDRIPYLKKIISRIYSNKLENLFLDFKRNGIKIFFYVHDYNTFSRLTTVGLIDSIFRKKLYDLSDYVIFAENSAYNSFKMTYGERINVIIAKLPDYTKFHGNLFSKEYIRSKYNISISDTVILSIGTRRKYRNLDRYVLLSCDFPDLIFISSETKINKYNKKNIKIKKYLSHLEFLEMLSLADYIINPTKNYLTSGIIAIARQYCIPVIAENFGSTIDVYDNYFIKMNYEDDIYDKLKSLPRYNSTFYFEMTEKLRQNYFSLETDSIYFDLIQIIKKESFN